MVLQLICKGSYVKNYISNYALTLLGIILCMTPANERWCYTVMASLIGRAHTQNDRCLSDAEAWYWLHMIIRSLSFTRNDFNNLKSPQHWEITGTANMFLSSKQSVPEVSKLKPNHLGLQQINKWTQSFVHPVFYWIWTAETYRQMSMPMNISTYSWATMCLYSYDFHVLKKQTGQKVCYTK